MLRCLCPTPTGKPLHLHRQSAYLVGRHKDVRPASCLLYWFCVCVLLTIGFCVLFARRGATTPLFLLQICDVLTQHESCSKQHAIIQFRLVEVKSKKKRSLTDAPKRVVKCVTARPCSHNSCFLTSAILCLISPHRPYLMDLQSSNGTFLNGKRIDDSRYACLLDKCTCRRDSGVTWCAACL